jgi:hypothetical protein
MCYYPMSNYSTFQAKSPGLLLIPLHGSSYVIKGLNTQCLKVYLNDDPQKP